MNCAILTALVLGVLGMASSPLIAYVIEARTYPGIVVKLRPFVVIYYVAIAGSLALLLTLIWFKSACLLILGEPAAPFVLGLAVVLAAGLMMLGPIMAGAIVARVKASRFQRCSRCGYDLTGSVNGICPECGKPRGDRS